MKADMLLYVLLGQKLCIRVLDNVQVNHYTNIYNQKKGSILWCQNDQDNTESCLIVRTVMIKERYTGKLLEHQYLSGRKWRKHLLEMRVSSQRKCPSLSRLHSQLANAAIFCHSSARQRKETCSGSWHLMSVTESHHMWQTGKVWLHDSWYQTGPQRLL